MLLMVFQDPLFFLALTIVTFVGFSLKSISEKKDERTNSSEVPLTKLLAETIFLVLLTSLWMIILIH
jgi:hypothetical protein